MNTNFFNLRYLCVWLTFCIVGAGMLFPVFGQQVAESRKITGRVVDENKEPLIGVSILVVGTVNGTVTDVDGNYTLTLSPPTKDIQFSYVGYLTQIVPMPIGRSVLNVQLQSDSELLSDVIVIGYGTQRKSDLTGSVSNVSSKDFNGGLISSPEQLINGKVSGVQIMSVGGSPTTGSTIRVRGGASLNASNDPLIVLDGVPLEMGGISGNTGNFLSLINPNDIESMTILKDASSTAIYGSRASNGVIIITTKKGTSDRLKVNFTSTQSIQTRTEETTMLRAEQFVDVINTQGTPMQRALLGTTTTDWNKGVYRTAFGTDNNVSVGGRLAVNLPFRASVGYYNQEGLLLKDRAERITGNLSLSPSFFREHLKFAINAKGALNNNNFGNTSAIWAATTFNPTIPVYDAGNAFGGYSEVIDSNAGLPLNGAVRNPIGLVKQYHSNSQVQRFIGNVDMDYKVHFLPELRLHATVGYDYAEGKGAIYVPAEAAEYYTTVGRDYTYGPQKSLNKLLTLYANYTTYIEPIKSSIDATVGYDYQYWKSVSPVYNEYNTQRELQRTVKETDERHVLLSYYARLNYSFNSRYLLTATVRRDGTSRFKEKWGTFPSVALAWRVTEETFLKDHPVLSNLKLRASYGVTGQQEGIGNYNYLPVYTYSQSGAEALFGNQYYYTYRPTAYVENLKWETTTSWNAGFDFGLLKDRISGSVDYYTRRTKDLLAIVPSPAGVNFDKTVLTNVGNVDSKGLEITINATPLQTKDWTWNVSFNMTWQTVTVKNLSLVKGASQTNTLVGPTIDSYQFQVLSEGYAPNMFYVYRQLYDEKTGKPIEGAYADLNGDGTINSSDLYRYHSPAPDFLFGWSTSLRWKKWDLGMSLRANVGNYVHNGLAMNTGAWETVSYNSFQLNNLSTGYLKTNFQKRQQLSDYYVENASFLKMDNLTLGYSFDNVFRGCNLHASAKVQNLFCITKYSGADPEVPNGMDISFYPRPRTYSLSLGLDF